MTANTPTEKPLKDSPVLSSLVTLVGLIYFGWPTHHPFGLAAVLCAAASALIGGPELIAALLAGHQQRGGVASAIGPLENARPVLWLGRIPFLLGVAGTLGAFVWIKLGTGSDLPARLGYFSLAVALFGVAMTALAFSVRYIRAVPVELTRFDQALRSAVGKIFGEPHGMVVLALLLFIIATFLQVVDFRFYP